MPGPKEMGVGGWGKVWAQSHSGGQILERGQMQDPLGLQSSLAVGLFSR